MKALSLLLVSLPLFAAPINTLVTTGGVNYALNSSTPGTVINNWSDVSANTGTGFNLSSSGAGSVWLTANPYGLTNTTFTCADVNGCPGFQFIYTLIGATVADIAFLDVAIAGTTSAPTQISAFLACSTPAGCNYNNVIGSATVNGPFANTLLQTFLLLPPGPPPAAQANLQISMIFAPSGGGTFANGTTVNLPNSLDVTLTPEPSTFALAALALCALGRARRRR